MKSLFERLGGRDAVNAVVDTFYDKVMKDVRIKHFFEGVDMNRQRGKQKAFLTMAFGGPTKYSGQDMRTAHAPLVARGLNDSHVDAVIELVGASLKEHGVPDADIAAVAAIAESVRDDVLGREPHYIERNLA
jgi:hemoglobin